MKKNYSLHSKSLSLDHKLSKKNIPLSLHRNNIANHIDWTSPYFEDIYEGVTIRIAANFFITFEMNEEIPTPFTVASLVGYNESATPRIGTFYTGNNTNLGLKFEENNTKWSLLITKTQDYENSEHRYYTIDLSAGSVNINLVILINNIFDNIPRVDFSNPCSIPVS